MNACWHSGRRFARTLHRVLVSGLLLLVGSPSAASAGGWEETPFLRGLVVRAQAEHRVVLLRVGRRYCIECEQMDRALARTESELRGYLRARYDAGAGEGRDVARRYNVVRFPTLLVLGEDGLERGRVSEVLPPRELARRVDRARRKTLEQRSAAPGSPARALRLGREWAARGERRRAEALLGQVVQGDPDNRKGLAAQALLALGDLLYLRSLGRGGEAERTLTRLRRSYPRSPDAERALVPLTRAMAAQGRGKDALALLLDGARDAAGHGRVARFCELTGQRLQLGLQHARKALALSPRDAGHRAVLAALLHATGAVEPARASWQQALRLLQKR